MDSTLDAYRLPTDVTPTHYDLKIRTDLVELSFDGAVQITLLFITDTSSLTFNAFEIQLGTIFIVSGTDTLTPQSQAIDIVTQRVTLSFAKTFARRSTAVLHLTFRGKLSNTGFITSDWEHDGVKEHYSVSFLEVQVSSGSALLLNLFLKYFSQPSRGVYFRAGMSLSSRRHSLYPSSRARARSI
jgi:hypothetical protein